MCTLGETSSSIFINSMSLQIPLYQNTPQMSKSHVSINGRSETIIPIRLINPYNIKEGIISSSKLNEFLLIPNSIVNV